MVSNIWCLWLFFCFCSFCNKIVKYDLNTKPFSNLYAYRLEVVLHTVDEQLYGHKFRRMRDETLVLSGITVCELVESDGEVSFSILLKDGLNSVLQDRVLMFCWPMSVLYVIHIQAVVVSPRYINVSKVVLIFTWSTWQDNRISNNTLKLDRWILWSERDFKSLHSVFMHLKLTFYVLFELE